MNPHLSDFYRSPSQHNLLERLSFSIYDKLPKWQPYYPNPILLSNFFRDYSEIAWHSNYQTIYPHTLQYRMLHAITTNNIKQIKTILMNKQFKIDEPIQKKYQMNSLMYASITNRYNIIQLLLLHGANINQQDKYGNTPLIKAVINQNLQSINTLMKNGCDRNITNHYGINAIDKSKQIRKTHITNFITNYPKSQRIFPYFKVQLDIQTNIRNPVYDYLANYKIYDSKPKVYPFNNFKGQYRIDLTSYRTLQQISEIKD